MDDNSITAEMVAKATAFNAACRPGADAVIANYQRGLLTLADLIDQLIDVHDAVSIATLPEEER